jgi:MFS family permease
MTIRLTRLVPALGIAQIVSWGTLYYSIAVLGESMCADLGISSTILFGAFTLGLLASGAASPIVGRLIDARGGRLVLSSGSIVGAIALATLASAKGIVSLGAGWVLAGLAMAACLYDPAFATLHRTTGAAYRRAVTALTLFGGFASTVFWPASQWLLERLGWREALWIFAGLHLLLCLPLHLFLVPARGEAISALASARDEGVADQLAPRRRAPPRAAFLWLAVALSLASFLSATLSAHLITLLKSGGMAVRDAVIVSSLIGPMQVAGRVVEFTFGRRLPAVRVGAIAFVLMLAAMACLPLVGNSWLLAVGFAMLYGWSNGVMTIVRGTVPAALFGRKGYGALLGKLALPSFVAKAVAPVAFTAALAAGLPREQSLWALVAAAGFALAAFRRATGRLAGDA